MKPANIFIHYPSLNPNVINFKQFEEDDI